MITDLGYGPSPAEQEELDALEAAEEAADAAEDGSDEGYVADLDPEMADFVDQLTRRTIVFCEELWGKEFRPYQRTLSYRLIESLILQDAEEITGLMARQSGKSEVVATTLAGVMILFPILAKTYSMLEHFRDGVWVGLFAPVDEQSELVFSRLVTRLTSERAVQILSDPEIDEKVDGKSRRLTLTNGSFSAARRPTPGPRSKARRITSW